MKHGLELTRLHDGAPAVLPPDVTSTNTHAPRNSVSDRARPLARDVLLTVDQAAERLGTSPRFVRRLVAERRIAFIKLGRHVRLSSADVDAFIRAGRNEP